MRFFSLLEKIKSYFGSHWKEIASFFTLGTAAAFWFIPLILSKKITQSFLLLNLSPTLFLIGFVVFLLLSYSYGHFLSFLVRWKNNISLTKIPFTYFDGICFSLMSSVFFTLIFRETILKDFNPSASMNCFLWISFIYLILWFLVLIIKAVPNEIKTQSGENTVSNDSHFPDDPISDESEDLLGRKDFVDGLYNQVINYPFPDSFVFGLYGKWGEGKTSVLNLLKKRLKENSKCIVFDFDPWNFSSGEALVKGFYSGLYQAFNEEYFLPNFKKLLIKYQKIFTSGFKLAGVNVDIFWSDNSLDKMRSEIDDLIGTTGKQLIILIDDIDRLQSKEEMHQVFKLTKLSARFKKTIFILSFDPEVVNQFFKNEATTDADFLSKIIQAPINMPPADQAHIDKFLYYSDPDGNHTSAIDQLLQRLKFDREKIKTFEEEFNELYNTNIRQFFATLRDAKRYLNRIHQSLPAVKSEIHLADFFILELIGVFYPDVYADIWTHSWYYLPLWGEQANTSPLAFLKGEVRNEKIKQHIATLLEDVPQKDLLENLLSALFFNVGEASDGVFGFFGKKFTNEDALLGKRITHPEVFPKYFLLKPPIGELSDEIIETMISTWNELKVPDCEKSFIGALKKFQEEKKATQFFQKLRMFVHLFNQNAAIAVVSAIYKNITFISEGERKSSLYSKFYIAEGLLLALVNTKIPPIQIEEFLKKVIEETPALVLALSVVRYCGDSESRSLCQIYENVDIAHLQQKLSARLSQYFIIENRDIFEEEPVEYGSILSLWGKQSQEDRDKVEDYVFNLIERNSRYIGKIIKNYILFSEEIRYENLVKLYNEDWLHKKIKTNYSDSYSDEKEKLGIDMFLEVFKGRNS